MIAISSTQYPSNYQCVINTQRHAKLVKTLKNRISLKNALGNLIFGVCLDNITLVPLAKLQQNILAQTFLTTFSRAATRKIFTVYRYEEYNTCGQCELNETRVFPLLLWWRQCMCAPIGPLQIFTLKLPIMLCDGSRAPIGPYHIHFISNMGGGRCPHNREKNYDKNIHFK